MVLTAPVQVASYQHLVVVMSIVLGLSVTQLLKGLAQIYRTHNRIRPYWLHTAWAVFLVVFSLMLWWLFWSYRSIEDWSFVRFVLYLSPMILFYFLTSIVISDPSDPVTSYKEYFFATRVGFFGTFAAVVLLAHVAGVVVRQLPALDPSDGFRAALIVLSVIGMRSTDERVHAVIFVSCAAVIVSFIAFFHLRLGQ